MQFQSKGSKCDDSWRITGAKFKYKGKGRVTNGNFKRKFEQKDFVNNTFSLQGSPGIKRKRKDEIVMTKNIGFKLLIKNVNKSVTGQYIPSNDDLEIMSESISENMDVIIEEEERYVQDNPVSEAARLLIEERSTTERRIWQTVHHARPKIPSGFGLFDDPSRSKWDGKSTRDEDGNRGLSYYTAEEIADVKSESLLQVSASSKISGLGSNRKTKNPKKKLSVMAVRQIDCWLGDTTHKNRCMWESQATAEGNYEVDFEETLHARWCTRDRRVVAYKVKDGKGVWVRDDDRNGVYAYLPGLSHVAQVWVARWAVVSKCGIFCESEYNELQGCKNLFYERLNKGGGWSEWGQGNTDVLTRNQLASLAAGRYSTMQEVNKMAYPLSFQCTGTYFRPKADKTSPVSKEHERMGVVFSKKYQPDVSPARFYDGVGDKFDSGPRFHGQEGFTNARGEPTSVKEPESMNELFRDMPEEGEIMSETEHNVVMTEKEDGVVNLTVEDGDQESLDIDIASLAGASGISTEQMREALLVIYGKKSEKRTVDGEPKRFERGPIMPDSRAWFRGTEAERRDRAKEAEEGMKVWGSGAEIPEPRVVKKKLSGSKCHKRGELSEAGKTLDEMVVENLCETAAMIEKGGCDSTNGEDGF